MFYGFLRAGALIQMRVQNFQVQGLQGEQREQAWLCQWEKGGKQRRPPAHHFLRSHVEAYLSAAELGSKPAERQVPLFQSAPGGRGASREGRSTASLSGALSDVAARLSGYRLPFAAIRFAPPALLSIRRIAVASTLSLVSLDTLILATPCSTADRIRLILGR